MGAKNRQQDNLRVKMRELTDQRNYFHGSINQLEGKIQTYRSYLQSQSMQNQHNYGQGEGARPLTKKPTRRKRDQSSNFDQQSMKSRQSIRSQSSKRSSPIRTSFKER